MHDGFTIPGKIAFGAGIFIVLQWASAPPQFVSRWNAEASRRLDVGRSFWVFLTTVPLSSLSTTRTNTAMSVRFSMAGIRQLS